MKKNLISAVLSVAMIAVLSAGCGSAAGSGSTTAAAAATTAAVSKAAATTAAAAAATTAAAASKAAATTAAASKDTKGKKVALFMSHMSNEFTIMLSGAVEKEVKSLGYDYSVYDAKQDASQQSDQIEQAVTLGVSAIIIEPVSVDGIVPAVKAAKEAGTKVVIVNQRISDMSAADCYVGADAETTGKLLMEQAMKDIGSKGNICELLGPMGSDGQVGRSKGFDDVTKGISDVQVIFSDTAKWETAPALTITENWLNAGKDIAAIVAQNDGMAIGAAKAVEDAQKTGTIKIYGVDATSEGLQAVIDGKMQATISQGTEDQGKLSADAADKLLKGEKVDPETIVKNVIYTKDNAQQALDAIKASKKN